MEGISSREKYHGPREMGGWSHDGRLKDKRNLSVAVDSDFWAMEPNVVFGERSDVELVNAVGGWEAQTHAPLPR